MKAVETYNGMPKRCGAPQRCDTAMRGMRGNTVAELVICLAISLVLTTISVSSVRTTINTFNLNSAVTAASWAIQSTRYLAIMNAYPFAVSFDPATFSYQVSSKPSGASLFSNVGGAVKLLNNATLTLSPATTLQFNANGTVIATAGSLSFTISNGSLVKTISVSAVGSLKVTP